MKKTLSLLFACAVLFSLVSCAKQVTPAEPFPENVTFVFCGYEPFDNGSYGRYPKTEPLFPDAPRPLWEKVQNPSAPRERKLAINGQSCTLPYAGSLYRSHESTLTDCYELRSESGIISAYYSDSGKLLSFSDLALSDLKYGCEDLSQNGVGYFQDLADRAIKQYFGVQSADYRVQIKTKQSLSREDGASNPVYDGFVPEQQDLSYTQCVKTYSFTYVKYAKDTPTEENIQTEVRQDGKVVWLKNWYSGSMDAYTDFSVPEDKIRAAAEQIAKDAVDPVVYHEIACEAGSVTLCLDQDKNPYFKVEVTVRLALKESFWDGEGGQTFDYTDLLFLKPEAPDA